MIERCPTGIATTKSQQLKNPKDQMSSPASTPAPLGMIEPHRGLLTLPAPGQLIYKVMRLEHLLASISESYLHFNRVDAYSDFPGADPNDGAQLASDRPGNTAAHFLRAPEFTAAAYYERSRSRTYACCFSLENTDHIWRNYGSGGAYGRIGVVFDFAKLRQHLNVQLASEAAHLQIDGQPGGQIFSVNYGVVEYVDWNQHRANVKHMPNPILYTYMKDAHFSVERELRISLSALGIGHFAFGGQPLAFPPSLHMSFDFRAAIAEGCIQQILLGPDCDADFAEEALAKFGIRAA